VDAQPLLGISRVREAISSSLGPVMKIRLGVLARFTRGSCEIQPPQARCPFAQLTWALLPPITGSLMPTTYALLSTYPPTQCGLATFAAALLAHLPQPGDQIAVVRVLEESASCCADEVVVEEVVHELVVGSAESASAAVDVLNGFDVVIVQHEYGIYGGPDGQDVLSLLEALHVPTIVVLHTVLAHPTLRQHTILRRVIAAADAVVTMTLTARSRVLDTYGTGPEKVFLIPHGAADNRIAATSTGNPGRSKMGRSKMGRSKMGRPKILTWGLLAPRKGIEDAIDAMVLLRDHGLHVDYRIIGQTHPREHMRDGESYRRALAARASAGGVEDRVHFDDRFLPPAALGQLISTADVVLLPYVSLEQVTSGVLIEAITAGKPVVSTRFPHAVELLGAGLLVERHDPAGLAEALRCVLTEPGISARMSEYSAGLAPRLLWPAVARSYRELASVLTGTRAGAAA
jgi:glycosyltransferase involved in cell wall biosynthesis